MKTYKQTGTEAVYPLRAQDAWLGEIGKLYDRMSGVWCADTCAPRLRQEWSPDNPTLGQCSVTAFLVQDYYGGRVMGIPTSDGHFHLYNEWQGRTADLTSAQFGKNYPRGAAVPQSRENHFSDPEKRDRYELLKRRLEALRPSRPLWHGEPESELCELYGLMTATDNPVSVLANTASFLYTRRERINWAGFYLVRRGELQLGPFSGKPACVRIAKGRGVCGTAFAEDRTVRVPDVHAFPGHIACDGASRSELVVPLHRRGRVWGVLDLDSPVPDRFTPEDQDSFENLCAMLEGVLG